MRDGFQLEGRRGPDVGSAHVRACMRVSVCVKGVQSEECRVLRATTAGDQLGGVVGGGGRADAQRYGKSGEEKLLPPRRLILSLPPSSSKHLI